MYVNVNRNLHFSNKKSFCSWNCVLCFILSKLNDTFIVIYCWTSVCFSLISRSTQFVSSTTGFSYSIPVKKSPRAGAVNAIPNGQWAYDGIVSISYISLWVSWPWATARRAPTIFRTFKMRTISLYGKNCVFPNGTHLTIHKWSRRDAYIPILIQVFGDCLAFGCHAARYTFFDCQRFYPPNSKRCIFLEIEIVEFVVRMTSYTFHLKPTVRSISDGRINVRKLCWPTNNSAACFICSILKLRFLKRQGAHTHDTTGW